MAKEPGQTIRQAIAQYNKLSKPEQKAIDDRLAKANKEKWDNYKKAFGKPQQKKEIPKHSRYIGGAGSDKNTKDIRTALRTAIRTAMRGIAGPVGIAATLLDPSPLNIEEDELLYEMRRKKVPGGGPDEADIKREMSNKKTKKKKKNYSKGGGVRSANY
jgi:hypothetical protein